MTSTSNTSHIEQTIPFQIKVSILIIIVTSIVGILYYSTVIIYQLYNPEFLNNLGFKNDQYSSLNAFVIIQAILHIGLLLSALLIYKLKKSGLYLYFISFFALLSTEIIYDGEFILAHIIMGLLIGVIITISMLKYDKQHIFPEKSGISS